MPVDTHKETLGFQTEVSQLLNLMIHSLYSNKEIFLRELISNASDAIDRLRFAMLSDESLHEDDSEAEIHVSYDQAARTITVTDNGIGMARAEVVQQIGTIAKSGTREFLRSLTGDQQRDANLIGQFGVGFYSSFVVADRVTLTTRRAGLAANEGVRWESAGEGEYTLETVEKPTRGTEVTLHLREGEDELLSGYRLRSIIRKYSDHITVPILMPVEGEEEKEKTGTTERVNQASALWVRPKNQIPHEEYIEFYKYLAYDTTEPLAYLHSRMEGTQEYILLLYIPANAPYDLWNRERRHGVKLYVRRVFIMDGAEELIPGYLRFLRGVIDSNDLPLNISREILQQNKLIEAIRANTVKKVLGLLADLAQNEPEKYATCWKNFGRVLKEGLAEDYNNQEALAKLFRFSTTLSAGETQDVSLETYVARMKEGQDKIYFITAESYGAAKDSPLLEIFKQKGVEVLLLSDPVDYLFGNELREFNKLPLQSVSRGEVDLSKIVTPAGDEKKDGSDGETKEQNSADEIQGLLDRLKNALKDQVKEVRVTTRLTTSPACLVVGEHDLDPQLLRLLKAAGQSVPESKPILEINTHHALVRKILHEQDEQRFADWAAILYDQSVLSLGEQLESPVRFVNRLNSLLSQLS